MSSQSATRSIIYLGMDVHKESITLAVLPAAAQTPTRVERLPNDLAKLKRLLDRLANDGYAFANVNAVPELDKEKREVAFTFFIDPGRRVYVRRILISGNSRTRDEVVRREMRQLEGGWYDAAKIARSKERINRLGFFKEVNIETPAVQGVPDQVDMDVTVTEQPTGNLLVGVGYSSGDGIVRKK